MSGFPARVLRSFFGPKFFNDRPVERPDHEFGAEKMEILCWQVAGMNLCADRVCLEASWDGSNFQISHQTEAWNAKNEQSHPTLARSEAGKYTYTFADTYLDGEGNDVAINLGPPSVSCHAEQDTFADRIEARAWMDANNPSIIHIRIWDATGTLVDKPFLLKVL